MAYTPITEVPDLEIFQWSTKDDPNPRLAAPISATDTTLTFTSAPLDRSGTVITGNFLMSIKNNRGYTENIYVPATKMSADGLTASDVIRGVRLEGLDYTTGDSALADSHNQDAAVACAVVQFIGASIIQALLAQVGCVIKLSDRIAYLTGGILAAQSFADATARDAAYTSPVVGDLAFVEDTEDLQVYLTAGWTDLDTSTASSAKTAVVADASAANGELYRSSDDSNSLYYKDNAGNSIKLIDITSQKLDTGLYDFATEAEAKAGTNNTKPMTPLRTEQAIIDPYTAKGDIVIGTGAEARDVLNVGSNDQVLIADSSEPTGVKWGGIVNMQDYTADTSIGATTSETTVASYTVPANILGTTGGILVKFIAVNSWSGGPGTIRVKFGSTTIQSITPTYNNGNMIYEALIKNNASASAQIGTFRLWQFLNTGSHSQAGSVTNSASEDTTSNKDIVVTGQKQDTGDTLRFFDVQISILNIA